MFNGHPPDIVVANAGVNEVGHLEDDIVLHNEDGAYPKKPLQITLDVNLAGAILTADVARRLWKDASREPAYEAGRQRKLVLISSMGKYARPSTTV
jgi:NAD(P)-dependent dehydrogenase (short-subunit alcohol dehydrogenase family)